MKTFLQQIEEAFEAIDKTDEIVDDIANNELEEVSTSAGAGAYMSKNFIGTADDDTIEALGMKRVKESVNTPPTYQYGNYQKPESAEEEYMDNILKNISDKYKTILIKLIDDYDQKPWRNWNY
jgi:hypothetical protein